MIISTVWNSLKSTLKNDPILSGYIKNVFSGLRHEIEPDSLPCIMIEPTRNGETEVDMNVYKKQFIDLAKRS